MSIRIENINVKNLGPISELDWDLEDINLVYGNNEKGKSYLVEFLIHSLFKAKRWSNLREDIGRGQVQVSGLEEDSSNFSPESNKKLEDFLSQKYIGLPPDFSKLLVLRSSSVELREEKESDKLMLRRFLSHKELLEKITEPMQSSVKSAQISGYTIKGYDRGKLKDRLEVRKKLERIEELFLQVEDKYLGGELFELLEKKNRLIEKYQEQEKAKRYLAYKINEKTKKLKEESEAINEEKINELISGISKLEDEKRNLEKDKELKSRLEKETGNFEWLREAEKEYEKYTAQISAKKPNNLWAVLFTAGIILSGLFTVLGTTPLALGSILLSGAAAVFYKLRYDKYSGEGGERAEIKNIQREFTDKFGEPAKSLTAIKTKKANLESKYYKLRDLDENLRKRQTEVESLKTQLKRELETLFQKKIPLENSKNALETLKDKKRKLEKQIAKKREELARLQVEEHNYISKEPETSFDLQKYRKLGKTLEILEKRIQNNETELQKLKQAICERTERNIGEDWLELINALANEKEQIEKEYKNLTAEIIAEKTVFEVIKELREAEDEKIKNLLSSDLVEELLPKVTTHYQDIYLQDDSLVVSDPPDDFPISQISDGAKEQVFLALRIALALQWFKKEGLFLILDDAFIHSDKTRKPSLVKKIVELGNSGWQIICLTFDDRVKNLFEQETTNYNLLNLNKY